MKVSKILPPTPVILISVSYISYIFSDLQSCSFIYQTHPHFSPPQQPRLSNFASFLTVRQALESIKCWIVVITISSINIILFLLFELDFLSIWRYIRTLYQNSSEYVSWNVAPMEHISNRNIEMFSLLLCFSRFCFFFYLYTVVLIGLNGKFSRKEYFYEGLTPLVFEPQ